MNKKTWEYIRHFISKYKYALLVCLLGLVLAALPSCGPKGVEKSEDKSDTAISYSSADELADRMGEVFSKIKGVGDARVILTLRSGYETIYVFNEDIRSSRNGTDYDTSRSSELAIVSVSGEDKAVYSRIDYPQFLGALVVCEGGDDPIVQYQLTRAVSSLTGLSTDKIVIAQMI